MTLFICFILSIALLYAYRHIIFEFLTETLDDPHQEEDGGFVSDKDIVRKTYYRVNGKNQSNIL